MLRCGLLDKRNTAFHCLADPAFRSKANEQFMAEQGFVSHGHRKKPHGRPMPKPVRRANGRTSKLRARVEQVFAGQKDRMGRFIRTIDLARASTKIGLANLVYNLKRLVWLQLLATA